MESVEKMFEKPRLQKMYMDFLSKEGYKPELESQGDVAFKYQGKQYSIEIYDEDPGFGRLCLMEEAEFGENLIYAHIAASKTSGSIKLVKTYIRDMHDDGLDGKEFIVFAIPFLLTKPDHFENYFQRMLDDMQNAYNEFDEIMGQLCNNEENEEK